MRKIVLAIALAVVTGSVSAQQSETQPIQIENQTEKHPVRPSSNDFYQGFTRQISYDRMIPPYGLEVTYEKTVHIIFPSPVVAVDLGSANIIAGKAGTADNVLRVKSAVQGFENETNLSVITQEGSFYSFNVRYAAEPEKLSIEMKDFIHDGSVVNRPNNSMDIYLSELGAESPRLVYLINQTIHKHDRRFIKHIGSKRFGVEYTLKGIFTHNGHLYFHTQIRNNSKVGYEIDFIRIKVVDKEVAKRTAIQETVLFPVRAYNHVTRIGGNATERIVFTLEQITIPDDKIIVFELYEKNGGRHQEFTIENTDLNHAREINELKLK